MNKLLLVTYHYPPSTAVGGMRPAKFARYLPEWGWEPTVLTVLPPDTAASPSQEETANIYRVAEWPHPLKSLESFKVRQLRRRGRESEITRRMHGSHAQAMAPSRTGLAGLKLWIISFLWLPDRETGWLIPAVYRGLRLIRQKNISHVVTTAPPFTCHLIGLLLKRFTGVHWVADFRDPWSLSHKPALIRNRLTDALETRLIGFVIRQADLVLSVTQPMTEDVRREHPDVAPGKFLTLTNGFDASEFEEFRDSAVLRPSPPPVVFSYLGTFYYGRSPEPFLRAMRSLLDDGSVKPDTVLIKFTGNVGMAEGQSVEEMVLRYRLEKVVSIEPLVPRRAALRQTLQSHVILVLTEQHAHALTFKVFEALASGAMILGIGGSGAVSNLLTRTGRGISVHPASLQEIREGILECIRRSRASAIQREPWLDPAIQEFSFRNLTGRLAEALGALGTA